MRTVRPVIVCLLILLAGGSLPAQQTASSSQGSVDTDVTVMGNDDSIIPVPEPVPPDDALVLPPLDTSPPPAFIVPPVMPVVLPPAVPLVPPAVAPPADSQRKEADAR